MSKRNKLSGEIHFTLFASAVSLIAQPAFAQDEAKK